MTFSRRHEEQNLKFVRKPYVRALEAVRCFGLRRNFELMLNPEIEASAEVFRGQC